MKTREVARLLELLGNLPEEVQKKVYFIVLGAIAVLKSQED